MLCVSALFAQVPNKFTYQAVVRNTSNQLVVNTLVGIRVSILQNSATGSVVYSETQMLSTNANGLVTLDQVPVIDYDAVWAASNKTKYCDEFEEKIVAKPQE